MNDVRSTHDLNSNSIQRHAHRRDGCYYLYPPKRLYRIGMVVKTPGTSGKPGTHIEFENFHLKNLENL